VEVEVATGGGGGGGFNVKECAGSCDGSSSPNLLLIFLRGRERK